MRYWPGTSVVKSANNAFDWNTGENSIMSKYAAQMEKTQKGVISMVKQRKEQGHSYYQMPQEKAIQTYSRAIPSVFKGPKF